MVRNNRELVINGLDHAVTDTNNVVTVINLVGKMKKVRYFNETNETKLNFLDRNGKRGSELRSRDRDNTENNSIKTTTGFEIKGLKFLPGAPVTSRGNNAVIKNIAVIIRVVDGKVVKQVRYFLESQETSIGKLKELMREGKKGSEFNGNNMGEVVSTFEAGGDTYAIVKTNS